jgi:hypothetical protein
MKAEAVKDRSGYRAFHHVQQAVYRGNPNFRGTDASVENLLIKGPTAFHSHSVVEPFIVMDGGSPVARFALIHDHKLPDYVQVSFFEALPDCGDLLSLIREQVRCAFPGVEKMVVGLNGHLNYGAGILLNHFHEPPVFGLPYSQPYYPEYFRGLAERRMYSYRLDIDGYTDWAASYEGPRTKEGLTVRFMDKKRIREEIPIYTRLNNEGFTDHPYWASREVEEDMELFYPFRFLLDNENLIFVEYEGRPVGFYLWYPDFNQLVHGQRDLNALDVLRFRMGRYIDTVRFTEIGVLPEFRSSPAVMAMLDKALPVVRAAGYRYCEVGFIFEENRASIALCKRILSRIGENTDPYRQYAVFEGVV